MDAVTRARAADLILFCGLLPDPDEVVLRLGQRDHLRDIDQQLVIEAIGPEPNAADIEPDVVEPEHTGRQLAGEVGGDQHDPGLGALDRQLIVRSNAQVRPQPLTSSAPILAALLEILRVRAHQLLRGHARHHGGIADRLQVHVPAILGALELDDRQPARAIEAEQIDAAARLIPVAELLRHHIETIFDGVRLIAQEPLENRPARRARPPRMWSLEADSTRRHRSGRGTRGTPGGSIPAQNEVAGETTADVRATRWRDRVTTARGP